MNNNRRPWRPSPFIYASAALHIISVAALVIYPAAWQLAVAALVADQLVLSTIGLWPRSTLLGPNLRRLPDNERCHNAVAITIDDGPDPEVTPKVLDLLDRYQAKATFFCIGALVEQHAELCREIVRRGHAIENHTQNHYYHFAALGIGGMAREVHAAQETLITIIGERPLFFRPTAGLRSPLLEPVLARNNLQLVSWTRRGFDTREGSSEKVSERLLRNIRARDILLLHDGNAARTAEGEPVILEVLPKLLDTLAASGLHSITLRTALS